MSPGNFSTVLQIKIMWPRGDARDAIGNDLSSRRAKTSGLSGFVSFKRRKDAEVALRELDGANWAGSVLRVGWSKAVPTNGEVLYGNTNRIVCISLRNIDQFPRPTKFEITFSRSPSFT